MSFRRLALYFALSVIVAGDAMAASDWPMSRQDPGQRGVCYESLRLPLVHTWQYNALRFQGNPSAPAVVDGVVYCASGDTVYAIDAETGTLKWRYPADRPLPNVVRTSPAVYNGMVYFGCSDGNLYALNAADGRFLWAFATGGAVRSSPIIINDMLYFGSDDDTFYAINALTGEGIWDMQAGGDIATPPAAGATVVTFASSDLYVYGVSQSIDKLLWKFRLTSAAHKSSPVVADQTVYIGAGSAIYGLSLRSGLQKMGIALPAEVVGSPAVADRDIYVVCKDKKLYAFTVSGRTAKPKWEQPADLTLTPTCGPTVAGDTIFVAGERGILAGFSAETGALRWRYVIAPSTVGGVTAEYTNCYSPPVVADGRLYLMTEDGALHCFTSEMSDSTPPDIFSLAPDPRTPISGQPPIKFSATIYDLGSGVDPSSIQLQIDGVRVDHTFDVATSVLSYETPVTQPIKTLPDGRHKVLVRASDWLGQTKEQEWSFVVDNTLRPRVPPRSKVQPGKRTEPPAPRPTPRRPAPPGGEQPPEEPYEPGYPPGPPGPPGAPSGPPPGPGGYPPPPGGPPPPGPMG